MLRTAIAAAPAVQDPVPISAILRACPIREENMKMMIAWLGIAAALVAGLAYAQAADPLPQFQVDPLWPKLLPNNWILG
jgi:hypothetical protein